MAHNLMSYLLIASFLVLFVSSSAAELIKSAAAAPSAPCAGEECQLENVGFYVPQEAMFEGPRLSAFGDSASAFKVKRDYDFVRFGRSAPMKKASYDYIRFGRK